MFLSPFHVGLRGPALRRPTGSAPGVCLVAGLCVLCGFSRLRAQEETSRGVFLPASSEYETLWQRLEQSSAAQNWDTVIDALTPYIQFLNAPDPESVVSSGAAMAPSVRSLLGRIAADVPPEAAARYKARLDPVVTRAWNESVRLGNGYHRRIRWRILRDYKQAALYRTALEEELEASFEEGNWALTELLCAEWTRAERVGTFRAAGTSPTTEDRVRVGLLWTEACAMLGRTDRAKQQAEALKELRKADDFPRIDARLLSRLDAVVRAAEADKGPRPAAGAASFTPGEPIWRLSVPQSRLRQFVRERTRNAPDGCVPIPFLAASCNGWIVFRHHRTVAAFDTRSRSSTWSKALPAGDEDFTRLRAPLAGIQTCYYVQGETLHCLELATGKRLWKQRYLYDPDARRVRLATGEDPMPPPPAERKAICRLSPPAFFGGDIVVSVAVRIDRELLLYVSSLDGRGEERWTTFLGSSRGGEYLGLGGSPSPPLSDATTVYCVTNAGIAAAADGVDGSILWLRKYTRMGDSGRQLSIEDEDRWQPNPIINTSKSILLAPQDSASLMALSRKNGELLWSTPRQGGSMLLGADRQACYIAGSSIFAVGLSGAARGRVLWRSSVSSALSTPGGQSEPQEEIPRIFGRGLVLGQELLIPSRRGLLRLRTRDGSILSRTLWDFEVEGGNLVLNDGLLGITGPGGFVVYNTRREEREALQRLPAGEPGTSLRRAKYHLKNFELASALDALRRWEDLSPATVASASGLDALEVDVSELIRAAARMRKAAPEILELLRFRVLLERQPRRKVEAAIELAAHLEAKGKLAAALTALQEALTYDQEETEYTPRPPLTVKSRGYIRERIRTIRARARAPRDTFRAMDTEARELLLAARRKDIPQAYLKVLRLYPYAPATGEAYLDLAACYRRRESNELAAGTLQGYLRDFPQGSQIVRAKLLLARVLLETGQYEESRKQYTELIRDHGGEPVPGARAPEEAETVGRVAARMLQDPRFRSAGLPDGTVAPPPQLRFPVRMAWRSPASPQNVGRGFLEPTGIPPAELRGCFLTQSVEVVDCRRISTGIPVWSTRLDLVPTFQFNDSPLGFRFPRRGSSRISGRYVGTLLVLHDDRNLFALDALKGTVRWHVPVGTDAAPDGPGGLQLRRLKERLRGVAVSSAGVFAVSTGRLGSGLARLRKFSLEGELQWETQLGYLPAQYRATVHGSTLFVHSQRPFAVVFHDTETGREIGRLADIAGLRLESPPLELPGGKMLLATRRRLKLLDLSTRKVSWVFEDPRSTLQGVFTATEAPGECIVVVNRANNWPAVIALSVEDGTELWRYEKAQSRRLSFNIFRKGREVFVLQGESHPGGEEEWRIQGLRIGSADGSLPATVRPRWPRPVSLGPVFGGILRQKVHIAGDSVIFAVSTGTLLVIDKGLGTRKNAEAAPITRFLAEKGTFDSALSGGKLILLTDAGDCAFESRPTRAISPDEPVMGLVRRYLAQPGDPRAVMDLATRYFRVGRLDPAVAILNDALQSENVLTNASARDRSRLTFLLDGLKEEKLKTSVPRIVSRRVSTPPEIDGKLNDAWDISTRVVLDGPVNIGGLPSGDETRRWEGEEDLSAILYTAWDSKYFYFAFDVTDDAIYPYDRDAENWKGDCLLIGLDPTGDGGYRQHGDDKLMTLALTIPKRNKADKGKKGKKGEKEGKGKDDDERKPDGLFSVKKKEDNSGAIYEIALPWASFSPLYEGERAPPMGYTFGLGLLLTDDDSGQGATKTLSLNPCILLPRGQSSSWMWRFIVPSFFPRVVLE